MRRLVIGVLSVSLLLVGCSNDDAGGDLAAVTSLPEETSTSSTTTTTEPETVAPDVIPADRSLITEDYVEQVLNALYEVSLEATLLTRAAGFVEQPAIELVEATSTPESARNRLNSLADDAANGFADYRESPGPVEAQVIEIVEATPSCIFVEAEFDSSKMVKADGNASGFRIFARLVAATEEQLTSGHNPTAWALDGLPATNDGSVPEQRCQGH